MCLQNVQLGMPSRYPSGKDGKLDTLVLSSVGEVRAVDMQVGTTGIEITFKAMGAGVITYGEHIVEDIVSQNRVLERTAFGGGVLGASKRD